MITLTHTVGGCYIYSPLISSTAKTKQKQKINVLFYLSFGVKYDERRRVYIWLCERVDFEVYVEKSAVLHLLVFGVGVYFFGSLSTVHERWLFDS
jgi:hypothetical protein